MDISIYVITICTAGITNDRQISLYVQRRIRVDVGHVFGVKTNPYLKIKYTFEIFHQPAVKL